MPCNMPYPKTSDENSKRIAALEEAMCDVANLLISGDELKFSNTTENLRRWYANHTRQPGCSRRPPPAINLPDGPMLGKEAIDLVQIYTDMLIGEQAEIAEEDCDPCDIEDRRLIKALNVILSLARSVVPTAQKDSDE